MTESKKKTPKKEVVEKEEAGVKPVKKAKVIKEEKEKLIEEALEEVLTPEETEGLKKALKAEEAEEAEEAVEAEEAEVAEEKKPKKSKKEVVAETTLTNEEFDWASYETDELKSSPKHKEYEAMYDETLSTIAVDEVVHGTVIQMTSREVVVNIGYKSEGVVSLNEFRYNPGPQGR